MLIIFDLDGVLLKASWKKLFHAYKVMISAEGRNYKNFFNNLEEFKKWWSPDWRKNNRAIGIFDEEESSRIIYEAYNQKIGLFNWARKTIKDLSSRHQLAILTNRHRSDAQRYIGSIEKYFFMIVGCEDVKNIKPDPEGINFILEKSGAKKENTLIIGDRGEDILAGKLAGVKTAGVVWGLGEIKDFLSVKTDIIFYSPEYLLLNL